LNEKINPDLPDERMTRLRYMYSNSQGKLLAIDGSQHNAITDPKSIRTVMDVMKVPFTPVDLDEFAKLLNTGWDNDKEKNSKTISFNKRL